VTSAQRIDALDAAKRASSGSARAVRGEMTRGLGSLASIAFTAPLIGVLGTLLGILSCFLGSAGDRWSIYIAIMGRLSEALIPMEMGLLVAVIAFVGHKYFQTKLDDLDVEMDNASLQLLNQLSAIHS
jgi:biopolymer transport protein ExbB